jgi:hypothetical protein
MTQFAEHFAGHRVQIDCVEGLAPLPGDLPLEVKEFSFDPAGERLLFRTRLEDNSLFVKLNLSPTSEHDSAMHHFQIEASG